MEKGVVSGNPVVDVEAEVFFGSYHAVDSSEQAFKTASAAAFRKAFAAARPVLLEPIVTLEVVVPLEKFGDISADLATRRGHITGMEALPGGGQAIQATVPLSEVLRYATDLKSMTGGQGSYTMEFKSYEPVPPNVQQAVVDRWNKSRACVEEDRPAALERRFEVDAATGRAARDIVDRRRRRRRLEQRPDSREDGRLAARRLADERADGAGRELELARGAISLDRNTR